MIEKLDFSRRNFLRNTNAYLNLKRNDSITCRQQMREQQARERAQIETSKRLGVYETPVRIKKMERKVTKSSKKIR